MRRYFVQKDKMMETYQPDQADFVLVEKSELDQLEQKIKNREEQLQRLHQKLTGENLKFRLIHIDYLDGYSNQRYKNDPKIYVSIHLPIAHKPENMEKAKSLVVFVFEKYLANGRSYKLHFAPGAGWSVNLELTNEEFEAFQLPE
ncbi:hypothetical protein [Ammoniphilus resinae]|uniref:Uncharacterized protein n=1 Tax=Ammoniphilus resinae TaxID=861532 RepID=A0ABS4GXN0_9BACL|nr:hypothetical protein [Ammoniphilus resinae]MBP1934857.1 hypothetical protein [Ammoniphilus resinae]